MTAYAKLRNFNAEAIEHLYKALIIELHELASKHRDLVEASTRLGCFYCETLWLKSEKPVEKWIDREKTAMCPWCEIDSVLPSAMPVPLTPQLLRDMHAFWFALGPPLAVQVPRPTGGDDGQRDDR